MQVLILRIFVSNYADISTAESAATRTERIAGKAVMWLINTQSHKNNLMVHVHKELKINKYLHNKTLGSTKSLIA